MTPPASRARSERLRASIALIVALMGLLWVVLQTRTSPPAGQYFIAGDGHYIYLSARSLAFDGDLDLTNQYLQWGDRWGMGRWPAADGWRLPTRELGPALLMLPGLWVHQIFDLSEASAPFAACLPMAFIPAACFWLISARLPEPFGLASGLAVVLGSALPFYAWGRAGYPHAADALATCLLFYALTAPSPSRARTALGFAAAMLMRLQNALWLVWPLWMLRGSDDAARSRRDLLLFVAAALIGTAPAFIAQALHPGSELGAIRWGLDFFNLDGFAGDLAAVLWGVHGLWSWTPLAAVACAGLLIAVREGSELARAGLVVLAALVMLMATVKDVDAGDAFGARRLCGVLPVLAIGLHALLEGLSRHGRSASVGLYLLLVGLCTHNLWRVAMAIAGELDLRS